MRDEEIKFGYAVTGIVHPARLLTNAGARPGDRLLLTKALGTGVISTAIKKQKAEPAWIEAALRSMTTLNRQAAEVIRGADDFAVHALTDVTGFGLIGHAREMALASQVSLRLHASLIPLLTGARECVQAGYVPGGLKANRQFAECVVGWEDDVPEELKTLFFDPQTAGGLLISVADNDAQRLADALSNAGCSAIEIGEVLPLDRPLIRATV